MDINGYSYKRDVLLCYDLKLPEGFSTNNQVHPCPEPGVGSSFHTCFCIYGLFVSRCFMHEKWRMKVEQDYNPIIDGEVESLKLIPVAQVANVIRRTKFFKPNCVLVITDFPFQHGVNW